MPKISIIGAGGFVFPLTLIRDVCSFPELQESTISLMDIAPGRLGRTLAGARALIEQFNLPTVIESTTDRRESLDGADFVVITW
ncbi:MAG: alpha-glucosidase/alpha-galactosidase, partial [Candidatus Brocadiae bacterium]|nr:alpha-glucosidase/alpha-galactosidase [Candidatus Brocadiia bacterium]